MAEAINKPLASDPKARVCLQERQNQWSVLRPILAGLGALASRTRRQTLVQVGKELLYDIHVAGSVPEGHKEFQIDVQDLESQHVYHVQVRVRGGFRSYLGAE